LTSNAAIVPGGTNGSIDEYANVATDVVIDINGYYASGSGTNTAFGIGALSSNTTGLDNTAVGAAAMSQNTTGFYNAASVTGRCFPAQPDRETPPSAMMLWHLAAAEAITPLSASKRFRTTAP
jgi:hypothetical protein